MVQWIQYKYFICKVNTNYFGKILINFITKKTGGKKEIKYLN